MQGSWVRRVDFAIYSPTDCVVYTSFTFTIDGLRSRSGYITVDNRNARVTYREVLYSNERPSSRPHHTTAGATPLSSLLNGTRSHSNTPTSSSKSAAPPWNSNNLYLYLHLHLPQSKRIPPQCHKPAPTYSAPTRAGTSSPPASSSTATSSSTASYPKRILQSLPAYRDRG